MTDPLSDLEVDQIRALLNRPVPQASPPITIGPFTNVPAPGSPIRSDWAQDISTYVTNYLPTIFVTIATVALSGTIPNSTTPVTIGTVVIPASPYPRTVYVTGSMAVSTAATAVFELKLAASSNVAVAPIGRGSGNGTSVHTPPTPFGLPANTACTLSATGAFTTAPGATGTVVAGLSRMDALVFPISGYKA